MGISRIVYASTPVDKEDPSFKNHISKPIGPTFYTRKKKLTQKSAKMASRRIEDVAVGLLRKSLFPFHQCLKRIVEKEARFVLYL